MAEPSENPNPWGDLLTPCDLWALPTPRHSRWFTQLDWYLNWQMCKGLAYPGLHLPDETHQVATEYGVALQDRPHNPQAPLLVAPAGRVPAARCVVIDGAADPQGWLRAIAQVATSLQASSVRVFLPQGLTPAAAEKMWPSTQHNVSFTSDLESTT